VLTKVNCEIEGDVFYPEIDLSNWVEKDSKNFLKDADNDYDFKVSTYERLRLK
jgi:dihydrofolate reductase